MENKQQNGQDALERAIREKLAHHSMPVDSSAWEAIQARLNAGGSTNTAQPYSSEGRNTSTAGAAVKRRRAIVWWIPLSAAASLAFLLTFGWLYQQKQEPGVELAKESALKESGIFAPEKSIEKSVRDVVSEKHGSVLISGKPEAGRVGPQSQTQHPLQKEVLNEAGPEPVQTALVESGKDEVKQPSDALPIKEPTPEKIQQLPSQQQNDWTQYLPAKTKRPLLAASLSSGFSAGNYSGNGGLYMDAMSESFLSATSASGISGGPMRAKAFSPADFDTKEYLPPLSAGVKIRLPFSDKWSLESGLQYTYLHTKLSNAQWSGSTAEMSVHYLGLPVGVALTLSDSPRWQLYLAGGILAEKGLQSVYDEYRDWGNAVFNTHVSKAVDGLQWSLYTSFGAGYYLDRTTMIYFEPQLSYFFDNDQPLSVRTGQPLVMGLSAGLRFSF